MKIAGEGINLDSNLNGSKRVVTTARLSELFELEDRNEKFSDLVNNWNSQELNKQALIGDALTLLFVRRYLIDKYPGRKLGYIHEMTKMYVANESMKVFLVSLASDTEKSSMLGMSAHTAGTVFEALTAQCKDADCVLRVFVETVNELLNPEVLVQDVPLCIRESSEVEHNHSALSEVFLSTYRAKLLEFKPKPKPPVFHPAIRMPETIVVAKYLHDNIDVERLPHKTDSIIEVEWRSRSKSWYTDTFYSCCGANTAHVARAHRVYCIRNTWSDRNLIHTGTLSATNTGRYGGGGGGKVSCDHIPVCNSARWTCCGREPLGEGCTKLYADAERTGGSSY